MSSAWDLIRDGRGFPDGPERTRRKTPKKSKTRKRRLKLFRKNPLCHWCKKMMTMGHGSDGRCLPRTATLDHLIPQSKGGSNFPENIVLACHECNNKRGNSMPPENGVIQCHTSKSHSTAET
jgi:5-methylcytosine-specific restriction endonuclease McrA